MTLNVGIFSLNYAVVFYEKLMYNDYSKRRTKYAEYQTCVGFEEL